MTGGRLRRVKDYLAEARAFCFTYGEGIIALGVRREGNKVAGYFLQYFRKGWRGRGLDRFLSSDVLVVREGSNLSVMWRIIIPENAVLFLGVMIRIRKFCRGSFQVKILPELEDGVVGKDERPLTYPIWLVTFETVS